MDISKWRKYNGALIPIAPPHFKIDTSNVAKIVKHTRSYFARWITEFDYDKTTDFWYVICDQFISLESLSRNTRSKVRRGLKKCSVRQVDRNQILENGLASFWPLFPIVRGSKMKN